MPFSKVLQLCLPKLFPFSAFEDFVATVQSVIEHGSDSRGEFNPAEIFV